MDINKELLDKINKFTRREHNAEELYVFETILCDNEVDRDFERFSLESLNELKSLFVGKTGIFDHNAKGTSQTARIFETRLVTDEKRITSAGEPYTSLKATAYMVRTEANADLIKEIDGGIKKEVSVSCACSTEKCSVCGVNRKERQCVHLKGKSYSGRKCHGILSGVTDAYEWSFVAVPAQVCAGVTKHFDEDGFISKKLEKLEKSVEEFRESVKSDIVKMCFSSLDGAVSRAFIKSVEGMTLDEMLTLKKELCEERSCRKYSPQLCHSGEDLSSFKI